MAIALAPVTYQIQVNGLTLATNPLDVEYRQAWGKHELFFVRLEYPRLYPNINSLPLWPSNAPVQIKWGRGSGNTGTFYGYVNHHAVKSSADSGSRAFQVTYTLIGTSKPMNSHKTRAWGQASPTYMAKQIAAEQGLRAVLTSTSWVADYEVQSSESDFAFLNRMAAKYGFRFSVSGGTLYFIDPAVVLAGSSSQGIPIFEMNKSFSWQDTIRCLEKIEGDNIPGSEQATRLVSGVDQNTGVPFTVIASGTSGQSMTKIQDGYVASTVAEAQVMADAWHSHTQFYVQASAELFGNSLLYPGKLVYLRGSALPGDTSGLWMVSEASHLLRHSGTTYTVLDKFVTRVKLIRNASGATQPNIKQVNVIKPEIVPCTFSGGRWTATSLGALYDGVLQ